MSEHNPNGYYEKSEAVNPAGLAEQRVARIQELKQRLAEVEAKYATLLERVRLYENKQRVNMPNNKISKTLEKCVVPRLRFHGSTSMAGKLADDIERLNQLVQAAKYAIGCYENGSGMAVPIDELRNALRNIELESEAEV